MNKFDVLLEFQEKDSTDYAYHVISLTGENKEKALELAVNIVAAKNRTSPTQRVVLRGISLSGAFDSFVGHGSKGGELY